MYVCMVTHIARVWINRVRLPILLVVSSTGKMNISLSPFTPKFLISRVGFGSPVPRQPAHLHTQAESGAYLRDSSRFPRQRPFIYLKRVIMAEANEILTYGCRTRALHQEHYSSALSTFTTRSRYGTLHNRDTAQEIISAYHFLQ